MKWHKFPDKKPPKKGWYVVGAAHGKRILMQFAEWIGKDFELYREDGAPIINEPHEWNYLYNSDITHWMQIPDIDLDTKEEEKE